MKRIALLMLCALVACDESTAPSDEPEAPEVAEAPAPAEGPGHSHEETGSMCDLYEGARFELETEDGKVISIPVPVECNPHYFYDGYPAPDSEDLPEEEILSPSVEQ